MSDNNVLPVGYVLRGPKRTYKIVSVLGRGGFGITYLAEATLRVENVSMRVRFAIKEHFMSGDCEREGESMRVVCSRPAMERVGSSLKDFISEARRLHKVGVDHPNIVKVNEVFEANGTAYYVMECLEGESLRSYVKAHGPLSEEEMLAIMRPVVDAVRYLHAARMTHLDIKPDNIMLTRDEADRLRPVLIDFGLAKHYDKDGRPTSTINILGCSDGYAPMEQYAGITTFSPAADCYALGATMWFCLTGKTPKKSTDLVEGELAREIADEVSPATLEMISSACRLNRRERTFPGLTAPADAPAWHAPSAASKTKIIENSRRPLPWRPIAIAVAALALIALAILAFRSCGSDPAALSKVADSVCTDTMVAVEEIAAAPVAETAPAAAQPAPTPAEAAPVAPAEAPLPRFSTSPVDMALCAKGPDGYVYITASQWKKMSSSQKSTFKPRGVYLAAGNFLVELHDKEGGKRMDWETALKYNLPTKEQGEVLVNNKQALNNALKAFGGTVMDDYYWTKTEYDSSYARVVHMYGGGISSTYKTNTCRVRAVAPVPVASAI